MENSSASKKRKAERKGDETTAAAFARAEAAAEGTDDYDSDDSSDKDDDDLEGNAGGKSGDGGSNGPIDELTRLRREKRLAMNRMSARARRKRKKVQLETLGRQVAELNRRNEQYQHANEALNAKITKLEAELELARSTVSLLTAQQQSANTQSPQRLPSRDMLAALSSSRDMGLVGLAASQREIGLGLTAAPPGGFVDDGMSLRRLVEQGRNQMQFAAEGRSGAAALNPMRNASVDNSSAGDQLLRRRALELQAMSQMSRENAMASLLATGRIDSSLLAARQSHLFDASPGLLQQTTQNTLASPQDHLSDLRLGMNRGDQLFSPNFSDARLPQNLLARPGSGVGVDTTGPRSQREFELIREMLKQQQGESKFSGDEGQNMSKFLP